MRTFPDLSEIKAVICDVDGVLTDGRIGYHADGHEVKFFDVKDGTGLTLARCAGLKTGILSGRKSLANETRAAELKLDFICEGSRDKLQSFEQILTEHGLKAEECMYVGDDLIDMAPMQRAGFAVAVADAVPELDEVCHLRTKCPGGRGAVREAVEILLKGQGKWEKLIMEHYRR